MEALTTQQVLATLSRADLPEEIEDDVVMAPPLHLLLLSCFCLALPSVAALLLFLSLASILFLSCRAGISCLFASSHKMMHD